MKAIPLEVFCEKVLNIYTPGIPEEDQCQGYKDLKYMLDNGLRPFSREERKRWKQSKDVKDLYNNDIRYLLSFHEVLAIWLIDYWDKVEIRLPQHAKNYDYLNA